MLQCIVEQPCLIRSPLSIHLAHHTILAHILVSLRVYHCVRHINVHSNVYLFICVLDGIVESLPAFNSFYLYICNNFYDLRFVHFYSLAVNTANTNEQLRVGQSRKTVSCCTCSSILSYLEWKLFSRTSTWQNTNSSFGGGYFSIFDYMYLELIILMSADI